MATIRASCAECGDVELTTRDVRVRVCTHDNRGTYSFRCPRCRMVVVKPAEPRTIELLVASGVEMSTWDLPAELREPRQGAPITHDDLLEAGRYHGQRHGAAGIVEGQAVLPDVGDTVLEDHEHVGAMIGTDPVARAEVLIDPDAHHCRG